MGIGIRDEGPEGFTLIEVLVSCLLTGMVLAMTINVFGEAKRANDLSKSASIAREEATNGVQAVVRALREAQIVYYTAIPLGGGAGGYTAGQAVASLAGSVQPALAMPTGNPAAVLNPPPAVLTAGGGNVFFDMGNVTNSPEAIAGLPPVNRGSFRVLNNLPPNHPLSGGGQRLHANFRGAVNVVPPVVDTPTDMDLNFTSPLCYFAVAHFDQTQLAPAAVVPGQLKYPNTPLVWDFHIIYLCPMDLANAGGMSSGNGLVPVRGASAQAVRDKGRTQDNTGTNVVFDRSTVPFELRLFSIKNVTATTDPPPITAASAPDFGRQVDPVSNDPLQVPYDLPANGCNYDPIMISMGAPGGTSNDQSMAPPANPLKYGGKTSSGPRVKGQLHPNFNALGNDPPNAAVFTTAASMTTTDVAIARYIDPDSVNSTFIRFVNDTQPPFAVDPSIRLTNSYEGLFLWNEFAPIPTRVVVSLSTRYRTGKDLPFQFSTIRQEITLEKVANYAASTRARMKR